MAIKKLITLDNGIPVNYHRIVSINKITNNSNVIEIASYVSEEKRQEELDYYNSNDENKLMNVYINTEYISKDYDETESIQDVYDYLKTTEKFKDAEDV